MARSSCTTGAGGAKLKTHGEKPGRFSKWPNELRRILKTSPTDAELWYFLGRSLLILSKDNEALTAFRNASNLGYRAHDSRYADVTNWEWSRGVDPILFLRRFIAQTGDRSISETLEQQWRE